MNKNKYLNNNNNNTLFTLSFTYVTVKEMKNNTLFYTQWF